MKFLLDTDICIELIRERDPELLKALQRQAIGEVRISSVTLAELALGAAKSRHPQWNLEALEAFISPLEVLAFDPGAALAYGKIRAERERTGSLIGALDMLIAAQALGAKSALVTRNVREFSRVRGLRLPDWG